MREDRKERESEREVICLEKLSRERERERARM